ncbi:Uridine kinase [Bifidobacterium ramosum]|uniref:Uridine kinase n=1 Tax=Bifidobacterium ramosum TaxID=1798158 RepID=A0A6L4X361_9BIFI|nr:hypothetical protein [Bifidobacterium ramosum]KAB8289441.1 Uridine kinase [Bifidobacterium ramosum]NEG71136.1 hypothetical protein [Bifidobacterium ramosum]
MNRNPRTLTIAIASTLTLSALAGCSTPFTTNGGNQSNAVASGGDTATSTDTNVRKFIACLTDKGIEAQAAAAPDMSGSTDTSKAPTVKNAVELRMIDAAGNPVKVGGDSNGMTVDSDAQQLYAGATFTTVEDDKVWVMFKDATALAGSPYASKQQDYAACQAQVPDFTQPVQDENVQPAVSDAQKQAALDFAKKAREKGYSWVADPDGDNPTTIMIPKTVSEEEFRRFLKDCPVGDSGVSFGFDGTPQEFGYDYTQVMRDAQ